MIYVLKLHNLGPLQNSFGVVWKGCLGDGLLGVVISGAIAACFVEVKYPSNDT
jgi:hypothetical protein